MKLCTVCSKTMRPSRSKAVDHPGTTRPGAHGLCLNCYVKRRKEQARVDAACIAAELDLYLERRRARLAAPPKPYLCHIQDRTVR